MDINEVRGDRETNKFLDHHIANFGSIQKKLKPKDLVFKK